MCSSSIKFLFDVAPENLVSRSVLVLGLGSWGLGSASDPFDEENEDMGWTLE